MILQKNIITSILDLPLRQGRRFVAIVGPPASGKSTLANELQKQISGSCVVPMDGFHLSNEELEEAGLSDRKGSPDTFDVGGLELVLEKILGGGNVMFPTFDRSLDCVIQNGGMVKSKDHTILVEGNYLILNKGPWKKISSHWDFSIMLDVSQEIIEKRLLERWAVNGFNADQAAFKTKNNDLPNAMIVKNNSLEANYCVCF
ncbi:phosphoribulokinase [Amylibacter sp.]|nr:phosphoribulokinase [Amylibacter sp.]MDC0982809.1 phosphoribulokinase [Amylibacter sp.]